MYKIITQLLLLITIVTQAAIANTTYTDVLVMGGGTAGTAAAIQAARQGVQVLIIEPTPMLGGMLTAAGVSAIDGNHNLPSGIWAEYRALLYAAYGGATRVATSWVSNTAFEPHVGDSILKAMVAMAPNIKVLYGYELHQVQLKKSSKIIEYITCIKDDNTYITIYPKVVIDATEQGEIIQAIALPYSYGLEGNELTQENIKGVYTAPIVQDLTYTAILQNYGKGTIHTIPKPANYNALEFDGVCKEWYSNSAKAANLPTATKMLDYAKLPNNKYLINWPDNGNDTYLNMLGLQGDEKRKAIETAKQTTLRFIYFIQVQLGYTHLGLANEYNTQDKLPYIPYYRESVRVQGLVRLGLHKLANPYQYNVYKTGIAVGDYPIDHHHKKYTDTTLHHLTFAPIPSYTIPLGSLIPQGITNLIAAEKNISVTNIVNGTTRLQPVVLLIGQAAGALAALCVQQHKLPKQVPVRAVQQVLLTYAAYLMPIIDVQPTQPHWQSIQRVAACGLLTCTGVPYLWANRTYVYPDSLLTKTELLRCNAYVPNQIIKYHTISTLPTLQQVLRYLNVSVQAKQWQQMQLQSYNLNRPITRLEYAVLIDTFIQPFAMPISHTGYVK